MTLKTNSVIMTDISLKFYLFNLSIKTITPLWIYGVSKDCQEKFVRYYHTTLRLDKFGSLNSRVTGLKPLGSSI